MQEIREHIGGRLRHLRQARRWTQAELASRLQISQPQLSLIERGKRSLTAEQLLAVLPLLNATIHDFVPADRSAELQNALARLGARHLVTSDEVIVSEHLTNVNEAIRRALIDATPRLITALAPVILENLQNVNLLRVHAALAEAQLERRLGWLVENVRAALDDASPTSHSELKTWRRAQVVLDSYLRAHEPHGRDGDLLDPSIRSERTRTIVEEERSEVSRRWGIVTRITPDELAHAIGAAREAT